MKIGTIKATAALAAMSLALAGTAATAEEKTLDIGVSDALTGGAAVYGLPQKQAIELAAEEINATLRPCAIPWSRSRWAAAPISWASSTP